MDRPLASAGRTSYRYRGAYGYTMIGARNHEDALNEAQRSLDSGKASRSFLEGQRYVKAE